MGGFSDWVDRTLFFNQAKRFGNAYGCYDSGRASGWDVAREGGKAFGLAAAYGATGGVAAWGARAALSRMGAGAATAAAGAASAVASNPNALKVGQTLGEVMGNSPYHPSRQQVFLGNIQRYAEDMAVNGWRSGSMITVTSNGAIWDGHHRIIAAQMTGTPIPASAINVMNLSTSYYPWSQVMVIPGFKP